MADTPTFLVKTENMSKAEGVLDEEINGSVENGITPQLAENESSKADENTFQEIKSEPAVDIDDTHPDIADRTGTGFNYPNISKPQITLTPTSKLLATTPNSNDSKRRYACPYDNCTKSYGKSSHLRSHLTWHTGIKPFVCQIFDCGRGFTRSDELNRHMRTHTGEKPFECVQCTKKFSRSDHLTKHLATHTKANFKSAIPKVTNLRLNTLPITGSLKTEHNTEDLTDECSLPVTKQKIKLENTNDIYPTDDDDAIMPEANAVLPLDATKFEKFSDLYDMSRPYLCCFCPMRFTCEEELSFHMRTHSIDSSILPLPEKSDQISEEDLIRPYQCSECKKRFKREDVLNRHIRTHSGERPYHCTQCSKRFNRSDHLKKHLYTHGQDR